MGHALTSQWDDLVAELVQARADVERLTGERDRLRSVAADFQTKLGDANGELLTLRKDLSDTPNPYRGLEEFLPEARQAELKAMRDAAAEKTGDE